jgi:DNA replication protein DnaC
MNAGLPHAATVPMMLTELRLPTIRAQWETVAQTANREGWPAERCLATLLEMEMAEREIRRTERHRGESQLPPGKLTSNFDFAYVPSVSKALVIAMIEGDAWLDQGANLLVFGPPGVGKTHLIASVGHALIERGKRVYFTRTTDLVQRLQAARRDLRLPAEIAKLDRFDLLLLDDFSYVRRDQTETTVLFELISERYERRSIALTANQPFSEWHQVFPEPAMTVAAIDRLVHHATILELNVESYRRKTAEQAKAGRNPKRKPTTTTDDN